MLNTTIIGLPLRVNGSRTRDRVRVENTKKYVW
jgi:hypothetical protein